MAPALSVVLAATHDGPRLRACLARLDEELGGLDAELLLADGSPGGLPPELGAVVHEPGASVFALRAAAATRARGALVAFTEDHCLPVRGWARAHLDAAARAPQARAVGGAVVNGTARRAIDRANFALTFGPFVGPLPARHPTRCPPPANVVLRRGLLPEVRPPSGWLELELVPGLHHAGHVVLESRAVVEHHQEHPGLGAVTSHFHNGRSTAGLPDRPGQRWRRARHAARLPARLVGEVRSAAHGRGEHLRDDPAAAVLVVLLACAHAAGELAGAVAGPGRSPTRLE